jgi:hypothetical protein
MEAAASRAAAAAAAAVQHGKVGAFEIIFPDEKFKNHVRCVCFVCLKPYFGFNMSLLWGRALRVFTE